MFEKSCRCGKTKKNFKVDIGEFFIDECCTEAGYDHLGKRAVDVEDLGLDKDKLDQQLNSQETQNLQIQDDKSLDEDKEEEQRQEQAAKEDSKEEKAEETKAEAPAEEPKKKRQYNRNGQIKKES